MSAWRTARRILCVRLDNMGDVLMSTPAMQALKDSGADRHVTLLTSRGAAMLAPHLPMVDRLLTWDAPWARHDASVREDGVPNDIGDAIGACAARLAAEAFDAAVIFTVYTQSALPAAMLCSLAGIPLRLAHCRENPYALLTDWAPETESRDSLTLPRHEVARQLDLVRRVGATVADTRMRFAVRDEDRRMLQASMADGFPRVAPGAPPDPAGNKSLILIHTGATAASRRWPARRFAAVARELAMQAGAEVFLTGSASEAALAESVCAEAAHPAVRSMAGQLPLGAMGALIERASLIISNNSGPVHLAAALGTPVVDLYALTNPQHGPWQVPHRTLFADVPCRYCYKSVCPEGHHRCLRDVTVEQVLLAARSLLAGEPQIPDAMPWHPTGGREPCSLSASMLPITTPQPVSFATAR